MMIPARTKDDHAFDSPLWTLAGCRFGENSGRSVTEAKLCSGGNDTGGDGDKVAAASRSIAVPKDRTGLSLEGGDGEACNSPTANKARATHMSASTAIVRERMA